MNILRTFQILRLYEHAELKINYFNALNACTTLMNEFKLQTLETMRGGSLNCCADIGLIPCNIMLHTAAHQRCNAACLLARGSPPRLLSPQQQPYMRVTRTSSESPDHRVNTSARKNKLGGAGHGNNRAILFAEALTKQVAPLMFGGVGRKPICL